MRRWGLGVVVLGLIAVAWLAAELGRNGERGPRVTFTVERGASPRRVAEDLAQVGLVEGAWQIRLATRLRGDGNRIKAGTYELHSGQSPWTILDHLVAGRVRTVRVTLPEGWTAAWTVAILADSLGLDRERLATLVAEPPAALRRGLGLPGGRGLEGYLFPETYRFAEGLAAEEVLEVLLGEFSAAVDDDLRARYAERGLDLHEAVTLASIVEAEAQRSEEAPKVAAVYLNRLREGWKLEADPTVAYALEKQGETITYKDLEVDSPYNTYRNRGLPPGPINSPGAAALRSVGWPEEDFPAMYFVADGKGGHVFSRTWEEHQAAVREYRRQRRLRRQAGDP